ncbi:hypothetical protein PV04_04829 [Phialophora macrospora]|uniref:FHA domain-containing protein n=1 Tax=Phialophora macrospora TaxID=1851006 RepID=A0A0D2E3K4_9EURO|nr:hypothetical protein PV04_04829 [Phialophora macrospora]
MAGTEHSDLHVTVTLEDVDLRELHPKRTITLRAPEWQVHIGRGTQSGYGGITAAPDNTWFDSKVMSRSHAVLRADPATRDILIEDVGSMHGTQLCGRRLAIYQLEKVWNNDTVTMGADVVRGSTHFSALRLRATWKWSDENSSESSDTRSPDGNIYRNTFTADYYSEDEAYEEPSSEMLGDQEESDYQIYEVDGHLSDPGKEDQVIQDSVREASVEIVIPQARTFTTPDSDDGSTQENSSLGDLSDAETESAMRSKIVTLSPVYSIAPVTTATDPNKDDPSQQSVSNPADVIQCGSKCDTDETSEPDSYADDDLEYEQSGPLETNYIPSSQTEAGPSISMNDTEQPEHSRAPSPSDAAMVKASGESTNSAPSTAPPFPPYLQYDTPFCGFVPPAVRPGPSLAGHNSPFCDPVPRAPQPQQRSHFDSVHHPSGTTCAPVYTAPYTYQAPAVPPPAHPLSPLSIASLVQQHSEEESMGSRKRKADQICSDTFNFNPASSEVATSDIGDHMTAASLTDGDIASPTVETTTLSQPALVMGISEGLSATNMEPPRKKARKMKSRTGERRDNGFIKMAAATITGMAIGAVGTIVGLAALPQDYFT